MMRGVARAAAMLVLCALLAFGGFPVRAEQQSDTAQKNALRGTQASSFAGMANADIIEIVGPICTDDQMESGILASITVAQFILESGFGKSDLAKSANNLFGMKAGLSGNTWEGSSWDGFSTYRKGTSEWNGSAYYRTTASFRKYTDIEQSIADHSAYLLGAMQGGSARYPGLSGCTDHREAIRIIVSGGYCTSPTYAERILDLIDKWDLTRFDVVNAESYYAPLISANTGNFLETMMLEEGMMMRDGASYEE